MAVTVHFSSTNPNLLVGVAEARGVTVSETSPEHAAELAALCTRRRGRDFPPDAVRRAVRDLLRHGGFKPTGRNKPASEYLARAADRDAFPAISGVVDAVNYESLDSGWPISLLDADRALEGTTALEIREGRAGESYVFNASGQVIDVGGLVLVARHGGQPLGNPVKDAMVAKTTSTTRNVLALLYTTRRIADRAQVLERAGRLAQRLCTWGGGDEASASVLPPA